MNNYDVFGLLTAALTVISFFSLQTQFIYREKVEKSFKKDKKKNVKGFYGLCSDRVHSIKSSLFLC